MDKNSIIGIVLIFLVFIGYGVYNDSKNTKIFKAEVQYADSLYNAGNLNDSRSAYQTALRYKPKDMHAISRVTELNEKLSVPEKKSEIADSTASVNRNALPAARQDSLAYGAFSAAFHGKDTIITIENNRIRLEISAKGGRIYSAEVKNYTTFDSRPVKLFDGDSTIFGYNFFTTDNKAISTNNLYFVPVASSPHVIVKDKPESVSMRLPASNGGYIEYTYTVYPDNYMIDFKTNFVSLSDVMMTNTSSINLDWKMYIPQQEKGRVNEENYTWLKYKVYQDKVDGLSMRQRKDVETKDLMKLNWIAYKDQFFSSVIIADNYFLNASITSTKTDPTSKLIKYYGSEIGVPLTKAETPSVSMKFYFGPNRFTTLKKYHMGLEELVFLGRNIIKWISQFIIIPVFNFLGRYISNYGIIILILTILIKVVLYPLTHKSYISMAKMKAMKPMVDEISKKFPKSEDAMKKQQATMALYKKAGVSPMGGCLPQLLQMPILFAMFRLFPTSIELRHQSFLWATDLSTYDSILHLPFTIPMYGDHVSLFTILMTVATIISMKMSDTSGQEQMPGMKAMMYVMPVMFMFMLNNFSSGLTYYYFLTNVIGIIQTQVSKRFVSEEEILRRIEENKKKPTKKSAWQKRLEEAQKQAGRKQIKR
jgi:YidC/Oxa1 family membrane protein insertase